MPIARRVGKDRVKKAETPALAERLSPPAKF